MTTEHEPERPGCPHDLGENGDHVEDEIRRIELSEDDLKRELAGPRATLAPSQMSGAFGLRGRASATNELIGSIPRRPGSSSD